MVLIPTTFSENYREGKKGGPFISSSCKTYVYKYSDMLQNSTYDNF